MTRPKFRGTLRSYRVYTLPAYSALLKHAPT